jgi:hypothetical protein
MKPGVRERIEYQAQERIAEKRAALEEQLWAVLEADSGFRAARRGQRRRVAPCKGGRVVLFGSSAREMAINIARRKVLVALGGTAFTSPLVAKRERP